jgi:two-component system sensor histidine kinase ChvG
MPASASLPQEEDRVACSPLHNIISKPKIVYKPAPGKRQRRTSRLTLRILAVNLVAPVALALGILYMGQYQDNLIRAELETLKAEAQVFAGAIAEGAIRPVEQGRPFLFAKPIEIETLVPEMARRMVRRLGETTDSRTKLFVESGRMIADSEDLLSRSAIRHREPMGPPKPARIAEKMVQETARILSYILPHKNGLTPYPKIESQKATDYPDAEFALNGHVSGTAFRNPDGKIILSAAAPVQKIRQVMGVVVLTREGTAIERAMNQVRFEVLTVFMGSLSVTIFLSLYLSGIIGRPLKKLARAAEIIRQGKGGRQIEIPDLSHRQDEIGELSVSLRSMTHALWDRMDTIERFAADVAHELKNPLTSLRSAVETASIVKNQKDKDKLMGIIQHDVQRLDRLISDISNASRLDAELSRDEMEPIDIYLLLHKLADAHKNPMERSGLKDNFAGHSAEDNPQIRLISNGTPPIMVRGNESRLAQVFENLISNALSFSPPKGIVTITISPEKTNIRVSVDDQGPGIPENKLDAIFERFYSERPKHEAYGRHSGLGLSIAKQIVSAHGGKIWAANRQNNGEAVTGARFTVILEKA